MEKVNWNVLVKSRNNAEEALKILGANINPENPDCLMDSDKTFVSNQDYITAVPVEIAMSVEDRAFLRKNHPDIKVIVTGVKAEDVPNLVQHYGYVSFDPVIINKLNKKNETEVKLEDGALKLDDTISFGDKEYSIRELGKIVSKHERDTELAKKLEKEIQDIFSDPWGLW